MNRKLYALAAVPVAGLAVMGAALLPAQAASSSGPEQIQAANGYCLTQATEQGLVYLAPCGTSAAQQWTAVPVSTATPTPTPTTPTPTPTPSTPTPTPTQTTTAANCTASGSNVVSLDGGKYHLQANEWNSSATLSLTDTGCSENFTVSASGISNATNGAPGAYPSLYKGCHWGDCTSGSGLPLAVSAVEATGTVTSAIATSTGVGGAWDDSYDIWFNQNTSTANNSSGGLEMMIWLDHAGSIQPAGSLVASSVAIDGGTFNIWDNAGTVSYVATSPMDSAHLDIGAFAANAVSRGYMSTAWYLIDVEAGFELWQGGQGLAVSQFNVCVRGVC